MLKNAILIFGLLLMSQMKATTGATLRNGGSISTPPVSPKPLPGRSKTPTVDELFGENEGSGLPPVKRFYQRPLHPNTLEQILTCPRVENYFRTAEGGFCPRGWSNAPLCNQPDTTRLETCKWDAASKLGSSNTLATMRAAICKYKRMKCLNQAGVIPGHTEFLCAPRNALSDQSELAETMSSLKDLLVVDFARNKFLFLSPKTFASNLLLRAVSFDQNFLLDIPKTLFFHNKLLKSVSFAGNQLDYIPPQLFQRNRRLTFVNFEKNNITILAPEVFRRNPLLKIVNLEGNWIPALPTELFHANPHLTEVDLSGNRISAIPKLFFSNSGSIQNVLLSANKLRTLPEHVFDHCEELRTVTLDRNMLVSLPPKLFAHNTKLTFVDISYNRFHVVSPELMANTAIVNRQWQNRRKTLKKKDEAGDRTPVRQYSPAVFHRKSVLFPRA